MSWKGILALKGMLAAPFLFCAKMRQGKVRPLSESKLCVFSARFHSKCTTADLKLQSLSITGDGLAKTISTTLLLQCVRWLIAVKPLDALGSNCLLYSRKNASAAFLSLTIMICIMASGKCNLPSHFFKCKTDGLCPSRFLWDCI